MTERKTLVNRLSTDVKTRIHNSEVNVLKNGTDKRGQKEPLIIDEATD